MEWRKYINRVLPALCMQASSFAAPVCHKKKLEEEDGVGGGRKGERERERGRE